MGLIYALLNTYEINVGIKWNLPVKVILPGIIYKNFSPNNFLLNYDILRS